MIRRILYQATNNKINRGEFMEYYDQKQLDKLLYFINENLGIDDETSIPEIEKSIEKPDSDMHGSLNIQQTMKSDHDYDKDKPFNIPCIFGW